MADPFQGYANITSGSDSWATVTPSDTVNLTTVPKALWVNVGGDISIVGADGVAGTFTVVASTPILLRARRVNSTGTTATGIRALY